MTTTKIKKQKSAFPNKFDFTSVSTRVINDLEYIVVGPTYTGSYKYAKQYGELVEKMSDDKFRKYASSWRLA